MAGKTNEDAVRDAAADFLKKALLHNPNLGGKLSNLTKVAVSLAAGSTDRAFRFSLIQVVLMDPDRVPATPRPAIQKINAELAEAEALGLPDGIEAHRIVSAAAVAATGGTLGCPIWDATRIGHLPDPGGSAIARKERIAWPVRASSPTLSNVALPKDDWKDHVAKTAAVVESTAKAIQDVNLVSTSADQFAQVARQRIEALEAQAWETNAIWWAQALYSPSRSASYRSLPESERLLWMADDLAAVGPARRHSGLESFFGETLRRSDLDFDLSAVQSLEHWSLSILNADNAPEIPESVGKIVLSDPLGLPVTLSLSQRGKVTSVPNIAERVQTSSDKLTLGEWATQVLRERQLVRWLAGKEV